MSYTFALIGNQNCGKTTLFNALTKSNQHVGNFPGVTVEKKEGGIRSVPGVTIVDLPGIYSLSPYSPEEVVTRDFLIYERPDAIINIVDATNIERNLYLSLQVIELQLPTVLALNMMDEVRASGGTIDVKALSKELGIPVVPISASKNEGTDELIVTAVKTAQERLLPKRLDFCSGPVHTAIHSIAHLIEEKAGRKNIPMRFAATKLVEGDEPMAKALGLSENEFDILGHITSDMEKSLGTDREAALADMRYEYIMALCGHTVSKPGQTKEQIRSLKIDEILTHRYLGIPIFLGVMLLVFYLTFGVFGAVLNEVFTLVIEHATSAADSALTAYGINPVVHSLVIDGAFSGVGSVLSFLPTILVLFFFLSILEDTGYMARVAFVMDKLLRKLGLSGRSFVPMLIGFGCSVPAIMATRTLTSERDRKMTILLIPFMSCSAKLPIYALFTQAFFESYQALVMMALYVLGVLLSICSALFMKNTLFKGNPIPFVMELPAYRLPSGRSVALHIWDKAKDFLQRAFTVIFIATIAIWFLQGFDFRLNPVENSGSSMLAAIGSLVAPVFGPLGFGSWQASTALLTGLTAKEAVVSTLAVLTGASSNEHLAILLGEFFAPASAFSFLTFTLLYMPCVAAVATVKRELQSFGAAAAAMAYQTAFAWVVSFFVYRLALLIF